MSIIKVGVDVDGILAWFDKGFSELIVEVTGEDKFPSHPYTPTCWDWIAQLGYTKAQETAAWDALKQSDVFWADLPEMPGAREFIYLLEGLQTEGHEVYFITNRMGTQPKWQTEQWLILHGAYVPTVIVTEKKAKACDLLGITHYIDDKYENCRDVALQGCCKTYMLAQPWNSPIPLVPRLNSLKEFSDILDLEAKGAGDRLVYGVNASGDTVINREVGGYVA